MQYDSYNCRQLAEEAQRVSARASEAAGAQESQATKDTVATTAAIIIFWPPAFLVQGEKQTAAELARLKGELEAIEQVSIRKQCGIRFRQAAAAPLPPPQPHPTVANFHSTNATGVGETPCSASSRQKRTPP
jgi:hypothetical protein